jgi:hypothetical protein
MNALSELPFPTARRATLAPAKASRVDLYTPIHKALRAFMSDTLLHVGSMDTREMASCQNTLDQVLSLLQLLSSHLAHENNFMHPAIEARQPGAARQTTHDHVEHLAALADLSEEAQALRSRLPHQPAEAAEAAQAALRLYRHLSVFVAHNFEHMQIEETHNNPALWAAYNDTELRAIHTRLLASIEPAEMALCMRWFAVALNGQELEEMFKGMQASAPAPAFEAQLDIARSHLSASRWSKLVKALGLAPVPGLVWC